MSELADAPTGEPQVSATPAEATTPQPTEAERLEKVQSELVQERVRSTIATELLTSDTRLASPAALSVVEHLVAQKVAAGVEVKAAVGAVLTEHPYLKAAPPAPAAAAVVLEPPATTGFSPAAGGTVSAPTIRPAPVRDALTMTASQWAAHRRELGL